MNEITNRKQRLSFHLQRTVQETCLPGTDSDSLGPQEQQTLLGRKVEKRLWDQVSLESPLVTQNGPRLTTGLTSFWGAGGSRVTGPNTVFALLLDLRSFIPSLGKHPWAKMGRYEPGDNVMRLIPRAQLCPKSIIDLTDRPVEAVSSCKTHPSSGLSLVTRLPVLWGAERRRACEACTCHS